VRRTAGDDHVVARRDHEAAEHAFKYGRALVHVDELVAVASRYSMLVVSAATTDLDVVVAEENRRAPTGTGRSKRVDQLFGVDDAGAAVDSACQHGSRVSTGRCERSRSATAGVQQRRGNPRSPRCPSAPRTRRALVLVGACDACSGRSRLAGSAARHTSSPSRHGTGRFTEADRGRSGAFPNTRIIITSSA